MLELALQTNTTHNQEALSQELQLFESRLNRLQYDVELPDASGSVLSNREPLLDAHQTETLLGMPYGDLLAVVELPSLVGIYPAAEERPPRIYCFRQQIDPSKSRHAKDNVRYVLTTPELLSQTASTVLFDQPSPEAIQKGSVTLRPGEHQLVGRQVTGRRLHWLPGLGYDTELTKSTAEQYSAVSREQGEFLVDQLGSLIYRDTGHNSTRVYLAA